MSRRRYRAFTLVELLVVIGIIVLLIGLLLPMISKAMNQGVRTRMRSDLNAIAAGLEAYKQDFGDYPRIIYGSSSSLSPYGIGSGPEVLGRAMLGLGGAGSMSTTNAASLNFNASTTYYSGQVVLSGTTQFVAIKQSAGISPTASDPTQSWQRVAIVPDTGGTTGGGFDGNDGPGFRVRTGGYGQVYGPYLQIDKFKTRGLALLDYSGHQILYFPANPAKPSVTTKLGSGSFGSANGNVLLSTAPGITPATVSAPTAPSVSFYNFSDSDTTALSTSSFDSNVPIGFGKVGNSDSMSIMSTMLGNYSCTGFIDSSKGESAATTASYLLWSAGPDGVFGPLDASKDLISYINIYTDAQRRTAVGKCDDVTNFTFGQ